MYLRFTYILFSREIGYWPILFAVHALLVFSAEIEGWFPLSL